MRSIPMPVLGLILVISACGERPAPPVKQVVEAPPAAAPAPAAPAAAPAPATASPATDPPPLRVALADDPKWQAALERVLAAEVPKGDPQRERWLQLEEYFAFNARDYVRAETADRGLMELHPDQALPVADLSVALGKQGRYADALAAADRALAMAGVDAMHVHAVRASWLWHLGRRDEARAEFAAAPAPARGDDQWPLWQGCRACFAASTHDLPILQDSLRELRQLGDEQLEFPRRDVIFDQYRAEPWFIEIVGETLAPQM